MDEQRAIVSRLGDQRGEYVALGRLGEALYAEEEHQGALQCFTEQIVIARELEDQNMEGACRTNLESTYFALGDIDRAIVEWCAALALNAPPASAERVVRLQIYLGVAYSGQGNIAVTVAAFATAVDLSHGAGSHELKLEALIGLARLHAELEQPDKAALQKYMFLERQ